MRDLRYPAVELRLWRRTLLIHLVASIAPGEALVSKPRQRGREDTKSSHQTPSVQEARPNDKATPVTYLSYSGHWSLEEELLMWLWFVLLTTTLLIQLLILFFRSMI